MINNNLKKYKQNTDDWLENKVRKIIIRENPDSNDPALFPFMLVYTIQACLLFVFDKIVYPEEDIRIMIIGFSAVLSLASSIYYFLIKKDATKTKRNIIFTTMFIDLLCFSSVTTVEFFMLYVAPTLLAILYYDPFFVLIINIITILTRALGCNIYDQLFLESDYLVSPTDLEEIFPRSFSNFNNALLLFLFGCIAAWITYYLKVRHKVELQEGIKHASIKHDIELAGSIQKDMLPYPYENDECYEIYADMIPAKNVGGDFYDFYKVGDDRVCLVIADVSGKGVQAALYMSLSKALLKVYALTGLSTDEIMKKTNDYLCQGSARRLFVTCFLAVINLKDGIVSYTNAGHNPPLIRFKGEDYEYLKTKTDFVIGGKKDMSYSSNEIRLTPGARLFFYTDGVTEAKSENCEFYSPERLRQTLNSKRFPDVKDEVGYIWQSLKGYMGNAEQYDDITMFCYEFKQCMTAQGNCAGSFSGNDVVRD